MQTVVANRRDWSPGGTGRYEFAAVPEDDAVILTGDARVVDNDTGEVVAVHRIASGSLRRRLAWLERAIAGDRRFPWATGPRLSGFGNANTTFGTLAPVPLRRRYGCTPCALATQRPRIAYELDGLAVDLWGLLRRCAPHEAQAHLDKTAAIHTDWRLGGGDAPWTSGIINNTAALPYHRDTGNVSGSWSAMVALRRDGGGGALHLPEYDLYLAAQPLSVMFFDGQAAWHGVTPLTLDTPRAYRYTIVWYAKQAIVQCGSAVDEPARAAAYKTALDDRRRGGD